MLWHYKNHLVRPYLLLSCFGILGILIALLHSYANNTVILQKPLTGIYLYGKVYKTEQSTYNQKSYIYLTDLITNKKNIDSLNLPTTIKVTYKGKVELNDIIQANFYLYPPSKGLYPWGFNFYKNAFFNRIGANGFILGKVDIIDNFNTKNHFFYYLQKLRFKLKEKITQDINQYSSPRTSPFLNAIIIGESTFLPNTDNTNLRKTSLAHLIAISGYHIGLITLFLFFIIRFLLGLLPRISLYYNIQQITALICIIFLLLYALLVGNHAPALRAIIMGIAALCGIVFKFNVISLNSLFLAILIILIFKPFYVYSASFLLSSVATLAVISLWNNKHVQTVYKFSTKNLIYRILFFFAACMVTSLFVEIVISPILAFYFQEIPTIGIVANILAEPIFAFIIMPSLIGYTVLPIILGKYLIMLAHIGMLIILKIATIFVSFQKITLYTPFFPSYLMYIYLALLIFMLVIKGYYKYLLLGLIVLIPTLYYCSPKPDIIIDDSLNLVAFQDTNHQYVLSNNKNKFIANIWFKDFNKIANSTIYKHKEFNCTQDYCIWRSKNKIITFANSLVSYKEDCGIANVIILTITKPFICTKSLVIDTKYIKKYGASFIFINKKEINIQNNY
ncbi:Competence protein [Candidatus Hepatincola sp. Av]